MIRVGNTVKLNVRPIYIGFVHKYYYEGPCRFAEGEALTKEFDIMFNQQDYQDVIERVETMMPDEVNLLEPIYVERSDDWESREEMFEAMAKDIGEVDLYFITVNIGRDDIVIEFAQRYNKPIAINPDGGFSKITAAAALHSRGYEAYVCRTWTDLITQLKVLRVRKVLQKTNVLLCTRFNSTASYSGVDTFTCLDKVTAKLGVKFRFVNLHELLDQMEPPREGGNHTTPGRETPNLTEADLAEANALADEILAGTDDVGIDRQFLINSLIAYITVKKNLDLKDCNGFTAPCPDACSTRRINQMQFTFCLTHSLLNEQGIPSACEYDIDSVISMMALTNISGNAPFMGNTDAIPMENGQLNLRKYMRPEELENIADKENLYYSQHSVPGRKFKGINGPNAKFGLRHFAYDRKFGAVMRYDFTRDIGQPITVARFSPDVTKLFVGKGTIVGGGGYELHNCNGYVIYRVADQTDFYNKQLMFGNHMPLVFGDYSKELILLGKALGLEVVTA